MPLLVIVDPSLVTQFTELIDVGSGCGGLDHLVGIEFVGCLSGCKGVAKPPVELLNKEWPGGEVGQLGNLVDEEGLMLHPSMGAAPHEAEGELYPLLIVHWAENKVILALCQENTGLIDIAFELVRVLQLDVIYPWGNGALEGLYELLDKGSSNRLWAGGWCCWYRLCC